MGYFQGTQVLGSSYARNVDAFISFICLLFQGYSCDKRKGENIFPLCFQPFFLKNIHDKLDPQFKKKNLSFRRKTLVTCSVFYDTVGVTPLLSAKFGIQYHKRKGLLA